MTTLPADHPARGVPASLDGVSRRLREAGVLDLVVGAGQGAGWPSLPQVDATAVHLHRHPQGFVDRHAIEVSAAGPGPKDLVLSAAADRIAHLTAPLVERLCDELPAGPVALWGGVADVIAAYGLWFARQRGGDARLVAHLESTA